MERVHVTFFRIWIALAIAVDLIAIASLFMDEGSTWAVAPESGKDRTEFPAFEYWYVRAP